MADTLIKCTSCKNTVQYIAAKEIPCKHVLCQYCFSMSTKQNFIRCPCCSQYFNIQDCSLPIMHKPEILKQPQQGFYQSIQFQIQSEIKILNKMLFEAQQAKINTTELFKQYDVYITQMFLNLSLMLDQIQQSLKTKIEEYRESNESSINLGVSNLTTLIERRKYIEQKVNQAESKGAVIDFNTQIEINSLEVLSPFDLTLYNFEFARNFTEIGNHVGQLIINDIQFPCQYIKIVPEYQEEFQKNVEIIKNNDESIEPDKAYEKLVNNNEIQYVEEIKPPEVILDTKKKIKIEVKGYTNEDVSEFNMKDNSRSEPFYNSKDDPNCEWFIIANGNLKQLPDFACKQIDRYRQTKEIVFIRRDNRTTNIADLKNMLYLPVDKNGNPLREKSNQLLFIPRN